MLQGFASTNPAESPSLSFTWLAPSITNGEILDYRLTCVVPQSIPTPPDVTTPTTSAVISNLENGIQYCCTVSARNAVGDSQPSVVHCITTVEIGIIHIKIMCVYLFVVFSPNWSASRIWNRFNWI